ncbi:MAG: hypothetical protein AAB597_02670 [Patescibacteria group bacterium]
MRETDWKKYLLVFVITAAIFGTALYISAYISEQRVANVRDIADSIAIDILSSETQFSLLSEASCGDTGTSALSSELNTLASKLAYTEGTRGSEDAEVAKLKNYYSLLEIKDYLLANKLAGKCGFKSPNLLYFYSNKKDCPDCEKMGYVLDKLREEYPELRVYAFDYDINLSAVKTLIGMVNVEKNLPAVVVRGIPYYGFRYLEEFDKIIPELKKLRAEHEKAAQDAASSTPR